MTTGVWQTFNVKIHVHLFCLLSTGTLHLILDQKTDVIGFLWKSQDPECNLAGRVFALRLSAVLLNSLNGKLSETWLADNSKEEEARFKAEEHRSSLLIEYMGIVSALVEQLLLGAYKSADWQKASVRNAWFASAAAMIGHQCPSEITKRLGKSRQIC